MKLFGTDGIRGLAECEGESGEEILLTPSFVMKIAIAVLKKFGAGKFIMVKDTRISSEPISKIFSGTISAFGGEILDCGVLPTPSASFLTLFLKKDAGFSISASHNPPQYNGIKIFMKDGYKADYETEKEIERFFDENEIKKIQYSRCKDFSSIAKSLYISFIQSLFPKNFLRGVRIVLDCANGSTYEVAPEIFSYFSAKLSLEGCNPNGKNINVGVGTEANLIPPPQNFDFKIVFDGDGDRAIIIKDKFIFDGDHILAILFKFLKEKVGSGVVGTILSNIALENFVRSFGFSFWRVDVGDRNVAYKMREVSSNLGGEESGHIITDILPTGDGIITSLLTLKCLIENNIEKPIIEKFPQVKRNIKITKRFEFDIDKIKSIGDLKREGGRAVVRFSGTEPLLRILVEFPDEKKANEYAMKIEEEIRNIAKDFISL